MQKRWTRQSAIGLVATLSLLLVTGCETPQSKKALKLEPGVESLFDGVSLDGWDGLPEHWMVEDGAITGYTEVDRPLNHNTFLVWNGGTVENFELRFKYRIFNGNSGVQYRSQVQDFNRFIVGGYQADMEAGQQYSGILYEERGRGILALRGQRTRVIEENGQPYVELIGTFADANELQQYIRSEDWNDYLIRANGNHLMHFINGKLMVDVVDGQASRAATSGVLAFQVHTGPAMKVQFKDIHLKRLP
jgi:hypothetical protein